MWRLGSQLMELQRREEADDAPRLDPGSLRQAGAAINRRVGEFIKSTPDLLKYPLVAQPFHGCARDTSRVEIAAACDAALTCHLKGPTAVTHCFQIGRASCRERRCPYVYVSVVAGSL